MAKGPSNKPAQAESYGVCQLENRRDHLTLLDALNNQKSVAVMRLGDATRRGPDRCESVQDRRFATNGRLVQTPLS